MQKFNEWLSVREDATAPVPTMSHGGNTPLATPLGQATSGGTPGEDQPSPAEDMLRKLPINPALKRRLIQVAEELHSMAEADKSINPMVLVRIIGSFIEEMSSVGLNKMQTKRAMNTAFAPPTQ